ncbi:5-methyltetrahydropteroyltriglutamate/homocystei neS-methyltransferase [Beutenbergia cavernae DSM 12333]|uniref:5-methyltetrahydropteroyltriglutamate--homocysteine S-methyltransferase n=1 Tax=Beutenbergia cavernae (strain ATCC BAA-8 / DSM 12333 / CCUG 43141 / JCM 11478 / NBRC 16432 / NCIMB 13614 / HKI 0122) TaxID=471853 RepID=C5BVR4_BEUC1|nr:5-methyltetrahydropteroyltriglutamate--homocysteine S-methyltransferase [Beutenbergia cavernae]ACQ78504.1 5-methyltetrahydropteroyltriglutamate/homocystei neS-methyltransferase [Beutenbergia cavernae DSM 12333]
MTQHLSQPEFPAATVLGYPRIGPHRELKKAVESFWAGRTDAHALEATASDLRARTRSHLAALGLGADDASVPLDFSYYDQVLDAALAIGAVPERFTDLVGDDGTVDLAGYFTIARGEGDRAPLEMTKWFDSNYHYLVPEIGPATPIRFVGRRRVQEFTEALNAGVRTRPVLVGPVTFLLLSKAADGAPAGFSPLDRLDDVVAAYAELLAALAAAGAPWVQLDEPALTSDTWDVPRDEVKAAVARAYGTLAAPSSSRPALFVATPYARLGCAIRELAASGVEAIGVDLVRGSAPDEDVAGIENVTLVGGVVDGHNIWRTDLDAAAEKLAALEGVGAARVTTSTSTSLFHVPHTLDDEPNLDPTLKSWLAFADEKVGEVLALAAGPDGAPEAFAASREVRSTRPTTAGVRRPEVRERLAALTEADFHRAAYDARVAAQDAVLDLPPLPTTTIGSFPQTAEIRRARAAHRRGELTDAQYAEEMRAEIARVVTLQEELGLDVLVHGEPERNDMVQYFAELLDGFAVTENGWVQSYGSRCTRPSILWGDVSRPAPMTVEWSAYTASLTSAPVKGMLTGPVTILAWSFVRDDQPLGDTANQVALALRDEIADLQAAGIGIIQVDEPALRELLPLRRADQQAYLDWSVRSFRLATSGAVEATQVHTHLCYSEFGEVIEAIDGLDADVTSIEAARSRMEILPDIERSGFARGIGPGVYDIHSPRVPSQAEVTELLSAALGSVGARRLWVNPDCGLKTRGYAETVDSLRNIVAATREVRAGLGVPTA